MRGIFGPKTQKTDLGMAMIAIPKPIFSGFTVFWAVFALKARKLPDLSGRQIRQLIWLRRRDLNPRPSGYERLLCVQIFEKVPKNSQFLAFFGTFLRVFL